MDKYIAIQHTKHHTQNTCSVLNWEVQLLKLHTILCKVSKRAYILCIRVHTCLQVMRTQTGIQLKRTLIVHILPLTHLGWPDR